MTKSAPPTTAQSLGALLESARDIMRKDKGRIGDLDRLPMLTWFSAARPPGFTHYRRDYA